MGLVTLADAKTYLGVSDSGDDDTITDFIDAAGAAMALAAGRHLTSASVTEYLSGAGGRLLWLSEPPDGGAAGVSSVHVDSARTWSAAHLVSADDYLVDGCRVERLDQVWPRGRRNVRVIYSAGFATVPDDLAQACKAQVAKLYTEWQAAKAGLNNLAGHSVEGWSQSFLARSGLDPETAELLKRHQAPRL